MSFSSQYVLRHYCYTTATLRQKLEISNDTKVGSPHKSLIDAIPDDFVNDGTQNSPLYLVDQLDHCSTIDDETALFKEIMEAMDLESSRIMRMILEYRSRHRITWQGDVDGTNTHVGGHDLLLNGINSLGCHPGGSTDNHGDTFNAPLITLTGPETSNMTPDLGHEIHTRRSIDGPHGHENVGDWKSKQNKENDPIGHLVDAPPPVDSGVSHPPKLISPSPPPLTTPIPAARSVPGRNLTPNPTAPVFTPR